jgi:WD40 repeat protein
LQETCPDGSRIVTASRDKTARIWDAATAGDARHSDHCPDGARHVGDPTRMIASSRSPHWAIFLIEKFAYYSLLLTVVKPCRRLMRQTGHSGQT